MSIINNKVLILGDLHLGNNKNNPVFFDIALKYADWVVNLCHEYKLTQIIQLGDVFHDRNNINVNTSNCAFQFFEKLKEFDIHIVAGNHDCIYNNTSDVNSLKLLSQWPNITIHEKVTSIDGVTFCGWGTKLQDIPDEQKIIFGHFDIKSFDMSAGKVSEHGFTATDLMEKCKLLMSGHYHKPQMRLYSKKPLVYTGSCFQLNWGESGEEKYVYILDTNNLTYERYTNTISPKHEYIKSEKDYDKINNNFIAIECSVDEYDNRITEMLSHNALDIKTIQRKNKVILTEEDIQEFVGIDINEVIDEWMNATQKLSPEDYKFVAERGKRLYNECI